MLFSVHNCSINGFIAKQVPRMFSLLWLLFCQKVLFIATLISVPRKRLPTTSTCSVVHTEIAGSIGYQRWRGRNERERQRERERKKKKCYTWLLISRIKEKPDRWGTQQVTCINLFLFYPFSAVTQVTTQAWKHYITLKWRFGKKFWGRKNLQNTNICTARGVRAPSGEVSDVHAKGR